MDNLYRSSTNRMIVGVCGGLAEKFDCNANGVRLVFVLLSFLGGLPLVIYLILWLVLKER